MSSKIKGNLLIAQGGGPTAVINCSLYGVIHQAQASESVGKILGARKGITGVLNEDLVDLRKQSKAIIERLKNSPGAALGSCRYKVAEDDYPKIMDFVKRHGIRYFFYNGGNDSMDTANKVNLLAESEGYELYVIGIPKTIDNDLPFTDHTPGYGSAARYVAQSVRDLGMDIRALPTPVSIFEAMGRNTGWLAAASVLAKTDKDSAPHHIYLPERAFEMKKFLADIESVVGRLGWAVVVVSEGIRTAEGKPVYEARGLTQTDRFGHNLPGDAASFLAGEVSRELKLRARSEKPGICGRASILCVSSVDQAEAEMVGRAAVDAVMKAESGKMVTLERKCGGQYECLTGLVPLADVANAENKMPDEFIDDDITFVTEAFREYVKSLIGGDLLEYVHL
jgi:6-phosphofructokinase 1